MSLDSAWSSLIKVHCITLDADLMI